VAKLGAGAFLLFLPVAVVHSQDDPVLEGALRKFQDDYYRPSAQEEEKIAAVLALSQIKHERTARVLSPLMIKGSLSVRIVVAREMGKYSGTRTAVEGLQASLRAHENQKKPAMGVRIMALRSLGELKAKAAASDVEELIADKELWVVKAAVDASGKIRSRSSIEPLIRTLHRIEGPQGATELAINPLIEDLHDATLRGMLRDSVVNKPRSERELLSDPIHAALQSITHCEIAGAKAWESWWAKNKKTFVVPD
jgi:hypothetical protein